VLLPANVKVAFEHYIETDNVTASAEKAGVARKTVYEWFKKYGDELAEMVRDSMAHAAVGALKVIRELALHSENAQVRLHAAKDILNRAGYMPVEKKELVISNLSEEEIDRELKRLLDMQVGT
jgi:phage terminase small subunit